MSSRPSIPEPIKRTLRQEAGFGCCKCGFPLLDYHHIIEYAQDHHFRPEDMMVLCPNCHRDATLGGLNIAEQRHYKAHPHNMSRGWVDGALAVKQRVLAVALGSNQFVGDGTFIRVDDQPLLRLFASSDGRLELSVELYDKEDNLLGLVDKNQWIAGDPYPWDLEFGRRWLRIRRQEREVSLYIDARPNVVEVRGTLWFKRQRFEITNDGIVFNSTALQTTHPNIHGAGVSHLCFVGAGLAAMSQPPSFVVIPDPRFKQAMLVSDPNIDERIKKGIEAWAKITRRHVSARHRRPSQLPLTHRLRKQIPDTR